MTMPLNPTWFVVLLVATATSGCTEAPKKETEEEKGDFTKTVGGEQHLVAGEPILVEHDGYADAWICVPTGPSSCTGSGIPDDMLFGDNNHFFDQSRVVRWEVEVRFTWEPLTPVTNVMKAYGGDYDRCQAGTSCVEFGGSLEIEGTSPLVLSGIVEVIDDGADGFGLGVESGAQWPAGLVGGVSTGQPYRVEGTLVPYFLG